MDVKTTKATIVIQLVEKNLYGKFICLHSTKGVGSGRISKFTFPQLFDQYWEESDKKSLESILQQGRKVCIRFDNNFVIHKIQVSNDRIFDLMNGPDYRSLNSFSSEEEINLVTDKLLKTNIQGERNYNENIPMIESPSYEIVINDYSGSSITLNGSNCFESAMKGGLRVFTSDKFIIANKSTSVDLVQHFPKLKKGQLPHQLILRIAQSKIFYTFTCTTVIIDGQI